ncbi:MAG: tRNA pseudouridine(38-40) synthase TruA [Oscillospiraceae bacterium]|nr:tRNA pseudouridine(38-40) synthase TruA [Oscillospiraceae bacterium]
MNNYRLTLSYDGTKYNGWQRLGSTENTIQCKVETTLSRLLGQTIEVSASGRTDAGVHARRQVCSFRAETMMSCEELLKELRRYLPQDVGALDLSPAPPRFHARLNCTEKTYLYRIWNSETPNVFERNYLYIYSVPLDMEAMKAAATLLCGEHDFSAFTSAKQMKKSPVRRIDSIEIKRKGEEIQLFFTGNGFLYHMVRILTGTLLEVGAGKRKPAELPDILASREREQAGFLAPAKGLILWDVQY